MKSKVAVVMGSDSDFKHLEPAIHMLNNFSIPCEVKVVSAHRTPERLKTYTNGAKKKGIKVIIAGAGGAAHLPGMLASFTTLPVVGVPVHTAALDGLDSLLSIVQMPRGVPVATMAISGAENAALMALRILAVHNKTLENKLKTFQKSQKIKVNQANRKLLKKK